MGEAKRRGELIAAQRIAACHNCRFFKRNESQPKMGVCRRYPASTVFLGINQQGGPMVNYLWPGLGDTDWCGEHQFTVHGLDLGEIAGLEALAEEPAEGTA